MDQMIFEDGSELEALHQDQIAEMLGYREAFENPLPAPKGRQVESTTLDKPWRDAISKRGYDFCVRWETGGKDYYERIIKGKPIWPGYRTGITIGCGYDLGYHKLAQFTADWGSRLPSADFERLAKAIGFSTREPGRPAKVAKVKALVRSYADIVVDWDTAISQFDQSRMPQLVGQLYRALDNLDRLHPHCRGALLSLTFNRGAGVYSASGDRFREGREIRRLMISGKASDFRKIPAQLRSMKRIWGAASSLARRRDEEADLFELGIREESLVASLLSPAEERRLESAVSLAEDHEDASEATDVDDMDETIFESLDDRELQLEAAGLGVGDVIWNPNDDEQPDLRHLPKLAGPSIFDLTAEDIENLIDFNDFAVKPGLVIFALRGARLEGADKRENVSSVTISDIRPNHRSYRCVIGVLDRARKKLWAYKASTVPNANAVLKCHKRHLSGGPLTGNILPTGCYTYTVGTHRKGTTSEIKGVLRLSKTSSGASRVIALRSLTDVIYDRHDFWHTCNPADNIHPGRSSTRFSSLGCLTLPGNYSKQAKMHSGLWADFRIALGMKARYAKSDDGKQFSCILLTGLDAAIASQMRQSGDITKPAIADPALRRLRFGSQGARVAKLQSKLGLAPDPLQLVGPVTRGALIKHQQRKNGWADGIWSVSGTS